MSTNAAHMKKLIAQVKKLTENQAAMANEFKQFADNGVQNCAMMANVLAQVGDVSGKLDFLMATDTSTASSGKVSSSSRKSQFSTINKAFDYCWANDRERIMEVVGITADEVKAILGKSANKNALVKYSGEEFILREGKIIYKTLSQEQRKLLQPEKTKLQNDEKARTNDENRIENETSDEDEDNDNNGESKTKSESKTKKNKPNHLKEPTPAKNTLPKLSEHKTGLKPKPVRPKKKLAKKQAVKKLAKKKAEISDSDLNNSSDLDNSSDDEPVEKKETAAAKKKKAVAAKKKKAAAAKKKAEISDSDDDDLNDSETQELSDD
jgi:hypothetical protein